MAAPPSAASSPSSSSHSPSALTDVKARAGELRLLLQKRPFAADVEAQRVQMRSQLEQLLVSSLESTAAKDVDTILWKVVTYQLIGEYRRRIALKVASLEVDQGHARAAEELKRIVAAFKWYLAESTVFYRGLITRVEGLFSLPRVRHALALTEAEPVDSLDLELFALQRKLRREVEEHKSVMSCHRWLVVLGDLARYHRAIPGLEESERQKYTEEATRYYEAAIFLKPSNGNPHNQLAVIASRDGNELEQLYRYCRSLACREPFVTALENMRLVFQNNKELFTAVQRNALQKKKKKKYQKKPAKGVGANSGNIANVGNGGNGDSVGGGGGVEGGGAAGGGNAGKEVVPKMDKLSYFLLEFVRVHGILFTKRDIRELETLRSAALRAYETVLKSDLVTEKALLQMIAVNIFACANTKWHPEAVADGKAAPKSVPNVQKRALKFTVEFVQLTVTRAFRSQNSSKYLGPLTTFFEWLAYHPRVVKLGYRQCSRGWTLLWKSASQLFTNVAASRYISPEFTELMKTREGLPLLTEELDLRGFIFLEEAHAGLPIVSTYEAVPSTLSRQDLPRAMRTTKLLLLAIGMASPPLSIITVEEEEQGLFFFKPKPSGSEGTGKQNGGNKRPAAAFSEHQGGVKSKKLNRKAAREQKRTSQVAPSEAPSTPPTAAACPLSGKELRGEDTVFEPGEGTIVEAGASLGGHSAIGSGRTLAADEAMEERMDLSRELWLFSGMEVAAGPGAAAASAAAAATSSAAIAAVLPDGLPATPPLPHLAEADALPASSQAPLSLFGADSRGSPFGSLLRDDNGSSDAVMQEEASAASDGRSDSTSAASVWTSLISSEPEAPHSFFSALSGGSSAFNAVAVPPETSLAAAASIWGWSNPSGGTSGWPSDPRAPEATLITANGDEEPPLCIDWNAKHRKTG